MPNIFSGQERKSIKQTESLEDFRRKRGDCVSQLRKKRREDMLSKRRKEDGQGDMEGIVDDSEYYKIIAQIPELVKQIHMPNNQARLEATRAFRQLLARQKHPPIDQIVAAGVIPIFVQFLDQVDNPDLQFEAAWALTNISSDESKYTNDVINAGGVIKLINLLNSPRENLQEQAAWALGNIAGDSVNCRNYVLNQGAMPPLLKILAEQPKTIVLRNVIWTVSNLCRGKPLPSFEVVAPAIQVVATCLYHPDYRCLIDACWAMSYLSDGDNQRIDAVIEAGVVRRLIELMGHTNYDVQIPALRTVGNIVSGTDKQTDHMLNAGCLEVIKPILKKHRPALLKEACWTLSNIAAGTSSQIERIIQIDLIPDILVILSGQHWESRKEAAWAISNVTNGGTDMQINVLVKYGCIPPLCELLSCQDQTIVLVALEAIHNILAAGQRLADENNDENHFVYAVEEAEGVDVLENLQFHKNPKVFNKVKDILDKFWPESDEDSTPSGFDFNQNSEVQQPSQGYSF